MTELYMTEIPDYIEARIRQHPPIAGSVIEGSTPVVAFGDVRKSVVATLGWNPSKREFLDRHDHALAGDKRRLETLASIDVDDLKNASFEAVSRVFQSCNNYFHHNPYYWFNKLEQILRHVDASYCDGSACHLDFVQWATDPVWGRLPKLVRKKLIDADLPFLRHQLTQEQIQLLLLNGSGIRKAYEEWVGVEFMELPLLRGTRRLKIFAGRDTRGLKIVAWNINLQSAWGVSNEEIRAIGAAVKIASQSSDL